MQLKRADLPQSRAVLIGLQLWMLRAFNEPWGCSSRLPRWSRKAVAGASSSVLVLREYSEDWSERLLHAPNHSANWGLVQFVDLSTDTQLMDWLTGQ